LKTAIVWFRRDLRIDDNPALAAAAESFDCIIPLYIHDPLPNDDWREGSASRWWLHYSLGSLDRSLKALNSRLIIRTGDPLTQLTEILTSSNAQAVFWNRRYSPCEVQRDTAIKATLKSRGIQVDTFNSALLKEPWEHLKPNGEPYRVFTPFWKGYLATGFSVSPEDPPCRMTKPPESLLSDELVSLNLLPQIPWDQGMRETWEPGEDSAQRQLRQFLEASASAYAEARDCPGIPGTSRLSPHLHFGEISPRRIAAEIRRYCRPGDRGVDVFLKEVGWREFAYHLLFHFPHTDHKPLDDRFDRFPWPTHDNEAYKRWSRGLTGYPIVDAGMRELWHTGWMHNRVRMIVASFLTKNLLIHWSKGAEWFWDTLVDADLAANSFGWQWTAGCGADAAPYFRIFNPILQGEKFDASGDYVRRWIPELSQVPAQWIHHPFDLPAEELKAYGVVLDRDYPAPIVELRGTRERALAAFAAIKSGVSEPA
jgi:deoxyribodipyrimidine photo-lyase